MRKLFIFSILFFSLLPLMSQINMPALFSDGMVLQRNKKIKIWGTTTPNRELTLTFSEETKTTTADASGNFAFWLESLSLSAVPQTLKITSDSESLEVKDVLVGDVFLLSGQSNMEWQINQLDNNQITAAKNDADYSNIRYYMVAKNYKHDNSVLGNDAIEDMPWVKTTFQTVEKMSAVGFYFGRQLFKEKNIPIGLIDCSQGASNADAWISQNYIDNHPELQPYLFASVQTNQKYYMNPGVLHKQMLSRVVPYTIGGMLWYQGEANAATYDNYKKVLPATIDCFRESFMDEELPFVLIQLSGYENTNFWPLIREVQDSVARVTPHTAMVSSIDVGTANSIHPTAKQPVGERCVLAMKNLLYGETVTASGPTFKSIRIEGDKAVITFDDADGLKTKNNILNSFEICDESYVYHEITNAEISGNEISVWNTSLSTPVAVRYAWSNFPLSNLYNSSDLPANPFRSSSKESDLLLIENFDYPIGNLEGQGGWNFATNWQAGVSPIIEATPLTYNDYIASEEGKSVKFNSGGNNRVSYKQISTSGITSGVLYASFLVNMTSATGFSDFFAFCTADGAPKPKVGVSSSGADKVKFGITMSQDKEAVYSSDINKGETCLLVLKYSFVSGVLNDSAAIFVNPIPGIPEHQQKSTKVLATHPSADADMGNIRGIAIRQRGSSGGSISGIRISKSWEEAVRKKTETSLDESIDSELQIIVEHDVLKLEGADVKSLEIYDTAGIIKRKTTQSSISLIGLPKGIYIVSYITAEGKFSKKVCL